MSKLNKLRGIGGVALVAACVAFPSTASAATPLKGWWPMNERSGQTVRDWSGNGNHGMLGSTPVADANDPTWIKGIFNVGSALRFAGDDFVTIADSPSLRPERLTVSAWVRTEQAPGPYQYFVSKGGDSCEAGSFGLYTTRAGLLSFYVYHGDRVWVRAPEAPADVWDGRWHHVAGTYDGEMVRLFVDGQEVGTGTPADAAIDYDLPFADMAVGAYQGTCSLYLVGDVDGVSIWDRALPIGGIGDLVRSAIGR